MSVIINIDCCYNCPYIRHKNFPRPYCYKRTDRKGGGYTQSALIKCDRYKTTDKKCPFK